MVYIFDPTTCEEPKKPTYRYSPIPKTVKSCCCPNPTDYEEGNTTGNDNTNQQVPVIPDKHDDNNSDGNTDIPEGGNTEVPPKKETTPDETNGTVDEQLIGMIGPSLDEPGTYYFTVTHEDNEPIKEGYVLDNQGNKHELTVENGIGKVKTSPEGQYVFEGFTLYEYTDTGDKFVGEGISTIYMD